MRVVEIYKDCPGENLSESIVQFRAKIERLVHFFAEEFEYIKVIKVFNAYCKKKKMEDAKLCAEMAEQVLIMQDKFINVILKWMMVSLWLMVMKWMMVSIWLME